MKFPSHIIRHGKTVALIYIQETNFAALSVHLNNPLSCIKLLVSVLNLALDNKRTKFFGKLNTVN